MQLELDHDRVNRLFSANSTELGDFLRESMRFFHESPEVGELIEQKQHEHGLSKKSTRLWDAQQGDYSGRFDWEKAQFPKCTVLLQGRPRMFASNVFLFLMVSTWQDGVCGRQAVTLFKESGTVRALLDPRTRAMPGTTTILENLNILDEQTVQKLLKLQLHWIRQQESSTLWQRVVVDSTAVRANAAHPVDSALIAESALGALRIYERMRLSVGIKKDLSCKVQRWSRAIATEHKQMGMWGKKSGSKKRMRQGYRRILHASVKLLKYLIVHEDQELKVFTQGVCALNAAQRRRYEILQADYRQYLGDLRSLLNQANVRVLLGKQLPVMEKVLSLKERDAAIIVKGQREAVFGYKIQFAFNALGYATTALVNHGNASDSGSLVEVLSKNNENTGIPALELSVDDGYAGKEVEKQVRELGVIRYSISGSKGKKQHGQTLWDDPQMKQLRQWRSAGESRIYTIKHNHHVHRLRRRGSSAVASEVIGKMIAYNFSMMLLRREQQLKKAA